MEMVAALMRKSKMDETLIGEVEGRGKALATARSLVAQGYIVIAMTGSLGEDKPARQVVRSVPHLPRPQRS
jgi:hypothetical protein